MFTPTRTHPRLVPTPILCCVHRSLQGSSCQRAPSRCTLTTNSSSQSFRPTPYDCCHTLFAPPPPPPRPPPAPPHPWLQFKINTTDSPHEPPYRAHWRAPGLSRHTHSSVTCGVHSVHLGSLLPLRRFLGATFGQETLKRHFPPANTCKGQGCAWCGRAVGGGGGGRRAT